MVGGLLGAAVVVLLPVAASAQQPPQPRDQHRLRAAGSPDEAIKVVTAGATSVDNIRFDLKDRERLERDALRMAVSAARTRAVAAAAGAGLSVDRILRIEAQGISSPPVPVLRTFEAKAWKSVRTSR